MMFTFATQFLKFLNYFEVLHIIFVPYFIYSKVQGHIETFE